MKKNILNAVVFNIAWLICVFGGSFIALPATLLVISLHLYFLSEDSREVLLIVAVIFIGVLVDSALIRSGYLVPPDQSLWPPLWLICLWGLFATTLNHSMRWFQSHIPVAIVLGGVAGALTYLAGTRLTEFSLKPPQLTTLLVMFLTWCVVFPMCLWLARVVLKASRLSQ